MYNKDVEERLAACRDELAGICSLLDGIGESARPTPYVKKYAVIRATGAIEAGFKQIIADKVDEGSRSQVKNFVKKKVRDSSSNPSLGMIEDFLNQFDERWREKFAELLGLEDKPKLKGSLTKLVNARNEFAHGGSPDIEIADTCECFEDGVRVLRLVETVVHYEFDEV